MIDLKINRVNCPGCGAPLTLKGSQAIITCRYCGCDSKVIRALRRVEPDLPPITLPRKEGDPEKDYERWGSEALINGILNEKDLEKRIAMAEALDSWSHAKKEMTRWIPLIVEIMEKSPPSLDKALSGIVGKLICHDDLKIKEQVILAGERYGFNIKGSKWFLFSLSLGSEATVKLLLNIAEYASLKEGGEDYAESALAGVQTAIGRISNRERLKISMEILLYRLFYVSGQVQEWILRFLRNHFDVGYSFMYGSVAELIDDCVHEKPDLIPGLLKALLKCRGPEDRNELNHRLSVLETLQSDEAKYAALKAFGSPRQDTKPEDIKRAVEVFFPFFSNPHLKEETGNVLKNFLWLEEDLSPFLKGFCETLGDDMPKSLMYYYDLKTGR